jgi:3-methylfumaryl-CoA hydratase
MPNASLDQEYLCSWIGRSETVNDVIDAPKAAAMAATLDVAWAPSGAGTLPPLWHWIYFWSANPMSMLGPDGHAQRGGFLPPVALPRRLWAGGRLQFLAPLMIGQQAQRISTIKAVELKQGKSGPLVFVTVAHDVCVGGTIVLREEHDIVYREAPSATDAPAPAKPAPADAQWSMQIEPDAVQLFRYSALTFNGHRIHYDRSYANKVEGYPGLIVHGPLIATLLTELIRRELPDRKIVEFSFRALSPVLDTAPFSVHGNLSHDGGNVALWAANGQGALAVQAQARLA